MAAFLRKPTVRKEVRTGQEMRPDSRHCQWLSLIAVLIMVATAASGCKRISSSSGTSNQGVTVIVLHPEAPSSSSGKGTDTFKAGAEDKHWKQVISWKGEKPGQVVVVIDNLRLQVDGRDYGLVKAGDTVTVDATKAGKVTVNDQERQPVAKNADNKAG